MLWRGLFGVLLIGAAIACRPAAPVPAPVTVYAAASLADALPAVAKGWTARSGVPVRFVFASSATLARQLAAGADANLFISADQRWMDEAAARGLLTPGSRRDLVANRLVLIAPTNRQTEVSLTAKVALGAALGPGERLAIGDPASVPAGRYAKAALVSLGQWDSVSDRLAPADDARVALAYVARGSAPLGIVYATDARAEPRVRVVARIPASAHPPIVYPAALLRGASANAGAFNAYLASAPAQAIFARHGFAPVPAARP